MKQILTTTLLKSQCLEYLTRQTFNFVRQKAIFCMVIIDNKYTTGFIKSSVRGKSN